MASLTSLQDVEALSLKFLKGLGTLAKLPPEIRYAIYELALREDQPICPKQVAPGSNKFAWGESKTHWDKSRRSSVLLPVGTPLTFSAMQQVSSSVWMEVRACGIFYKVNDLVFLNNGRDLASYLAAISPTSRAHIRSIVIKRQSFFWFKDWSPAWKLLATLCVGLRRLVIDLSDPLSFAKEQPHNMVLYLSWATQELCRVIPNNLRGLRCFEVLIHSPEGRMLNLAAELGPGDIQPGWEMTAAAASALLTAAASFSLERFCVCEPRQGPDPSVLPAKQQKSLEKLLRDTRVTVLGEHRGLPDPAVAGDISSRTRARAGQPVDSLGTLETAPRQYAADGVLSWDAEEIVNARIGDSLTVAEFQLVFKTEGMEPERHWVPFHALVKSRDPETGKWPYGFYLVPWFYDVVINGGRFNTAWPLSDEEVAKLPHPLDLADALKHHDGEKRHVMRLTEIGKAWGERSPRAEF